MTGIRGRMLGMGEKYRDVIRAAAISGIMDHNGNLQGTSRVLGYVCAIHDEEDENEDLRGTVDVQEYNCDASDFNGQAIGFHEGVQISAIQGNKDGLLVIPQLYSDVVVVQDPQTMVEYVTMVSHVSVYKRQVHDKIVDRVTEYSDFEESDEDGLAKDYDELEPTGAESKREQTASGIIDTVGTNDGGTTIETTPTMHKITRGGTTVTVEEGHVTVTNGDSTVDINGSVVKVTAGSSTVECDGSIVKVNGESYAAVLYEKLEAFLQKLCQNISSGVVPSPGSPLSTAPVIGAMASEIQTLKSAKVKLD